MTRFIVLILLIILYGCFGVNSETSEISFISMTCLDSLAWKKICDEHSIDSIADLKLKSKVKDVKNHFINPDYILYFNEEPKEIVGCNWNSIRVVYNENIVDQPITGLSSFLSNDEQKRIRNRVLKELMKYQCETGKLETLKMLEEEVPFAESHKDYPLFD